jgi:septal ring factor EnvC (AmiA/AmiB activator)
LLADQKAIVQRVEAKSASDLERAQRDIAHLQGRIKELGEEKAALRTHIDAQTGSIAQLKSVATAAVADKEAAEAARRISLDSYARQLCVAFRARRHISVLAPSHARALLTTFFAGSRLVFS